MSRLARLSLANRSVVALVTVAIAVFGWFSLGSLKQELIPSLQIPTAVVVAVDPGSSPELVEQQLTEPIEQAVSAVADVESVTSTSSTSVSTTTVELTYGVDVDARAQDIQQAVDRIRSALPEGVDPMVVTGSIDDLPVVQLAVAGTPDDVREGEDPQAALARVVEDVVVPRLEQVDGVREVAVTGVAEQAVTITLDLPALTAAGLSPAAVQTILQDNGVVLPTGTVDEGDLTLSVQAGSPITSVDDLRALPLLGSATGQAVNLGDVAEVVVAPVPAASLSRLDGEPALAVSLTKTPAGNTVDVSHGAQDAVDELRDQLGGDVDIAVVFDQAPFIEESIEGLATEGGLGLLFAVVVILLFLGSIRSTLVSAISIPLSLLVTFIGLQVAGYSLNILTLGAMTIAIGRVVDDSIVVIENIKRHLSYGEGKRDAIVTAVREVAGAITASTIATAAVFVPIGLVGGMVGELFRPFAFTTAIALVASLLVSLTIVPVLAYWFVKADVVEGAGAQEVRAAAEAKERRSWMQRSYLATLRGAIAHPVVTLLAALVVFAGTLGLATRLETNFLGDAGQNTLTVTETFPPATSLEAQDAAAQEIEEVLLGVEGVQTVQTTVGSAGGIEAVFGGGGAPRASFALTLTDDSDNTAVADDVREAVADLSGSDGHGDVVVAGADAAFGSSTVDVVVQADDPDELEQLAAQVRDVVADVEGTTDVTNDLSADQPTVRVTVDREAAAAAGLTETAVVGTVAGLMSPQPIGTVDLGAGPVDVTVVTVPAPASVAEVEQLVLPTATGIVPLTSVASVEEVEVPVSTTRIDGKRAATISATPADQDLGGLTERMRTALEDVDVPAGASVEIGGVAADQEDAFADLGLALLVALAIVYVVMVATFRSLLQPLILMVSVPFAATGALLGLLLTGTPLGVPALIGVLMLIGVVVTNAIVLVDLVNQYRERGRGIDDAVTEGSRKRLRPILMTAAATIFALVPMAFGLTGGGVFISQPLAIVVIGGLFTSTLLTLVLVPVLYTLVERRRERGAARRQARRDAKASPDVAA
ncbi:efflux RND transporter permease subunit [Cellulomonas xiejunii]|uniref:Efflux RND transporter permease subunit n=1 Tax=Cellulomonas xiejunii TaxID=2968083 RepID=A0ABY5KQI9_9CELL|nr:efflux RND transporter permease subunit [Cellulomonas xiejunii]MCC2314554.1 efflux RND transporter permease subunit [Cellulomonas xiejunii]MCC2322731.1 efflux RND transporter permease subunit [Cellulomonas xiejunii]UUI72762.1 efflux RND transporter permease subunit [Cellulomonas xiejunii]